jgi:hypothetical protein
VLIKFSSALFGTGLTEDFFYITARDGSLLWIASVLGLYVPGPTFSKVSSFLGSTKLKLYGLKNLHGMDGTLSYFVWLVIANPVNIF